MEAINGGYVAAKRLTLGGVIYRPGDPINVDGVQDHKVQQFLRQRLIRPADPIPQPQPDA